MHEVNYFNAVPHMVVWWRESCRIQVFPGSIYK